MSPSPAVDFGADYFDVPAGNNSDSDREDYAGDEEHSCGMHMDRAQGTSFFPMTPNVPMTPGTPGAGLAADLADPWRQLDPHEGKPTAAKPFRRGKTYRSLQEVEVLAAAPLTEKKNNSMRAPAFACFAEGYLQEQKRRQAERGETRRALGTARSHMGTPGISWGVDGLHMDGMNGLDDDMGDRDDSDGEDFGPDMEDDMGMDASPQSVDDEVELGYEDLCRQHVNDFFEANKSYMNESDLSQRVGEWQERMEPVLDQQASRPNFDIQIYGENILAQFEEIGAEVDATPINGKKPVQVSFKEMVSTGDQYEVCRAFLASLQLAVDGNVTIKTDARAGTISDDITLTCVTTEARRPTKIMDGAKGGGKKAAKKVAKFSARFAVGSPMVCETYGADEYDRAYVNVSPAPASFSEPDEEVEEVDADLPLPAPPSPLVVQATKKAKRAPVKTMGLETPEVTVPLARRTNKA